MIFELGFLDEALKEWKKLDNNTRDQFKKKLAERLTNPRVPASKLSGQTSEHWLPVSLRSSRY